MKQNKHKMEGKSKEHMREIWRKARLKYYYKNRKKELEYQKRYRKEHKDRIAKNIQKYMKKYYPEHKEERKKYQKEYYRRVDYYENNKESFKKNSKKGYVENKERKLTQHLKRSNERYKVDEGYGMRKLLGTALGGVIRYYIKTGKVSNPMKEYGLDWKGIMKVLIPIPQPRSKYNVDHIIPLYKFDLTDFEQVHLAFAPENHRWMLAKENMKRDKK